MGEDDRDRLARLEGIVNENSRRLDRGIKDQGEMSAAVQGLQKAVEGIQGTLHTMASDEIADLKRRAELPRRILQAVLLPVFVGVIIAVVGSLLAGVHI